MNINLILSVVMLFIGLIFLILSFIFPSEIRIGSFIVSSLLSFYFYSLYKRDKYK
ncbi:hypothetical protein Sp14A_12590 [Streptococcus pluranimalium]|uniref:Uncharacterized protein n=1 Tax=Streptococcus pluranimalium TaxID=82348 RepID=A0A345VKC1_9STRE|nr:hypothetical protein Sp14A_12590 [Streptococcus pluranimalium]